MESILPVIIVSVAIFAACMLLKVLLFSNTSVKLHDVHSSIDYESNVMHLHVVYKVHGLRDYHVAAKLAYEATERTFPLAVKIYVAGWANAECSELTCNVTLLIADRIMYGGCP